MRAVIGVEDKVRVAFYHGYAIGRNLEAQIERRVLETIRTFPLLERAQFWLKLRRLQKDRSHVHDRYGMEHETFRQIGADDDQIKQLNHEEQYELGIINERI